MPIPFSRIVQCNVDLFVELYVDVLSYFNPVDKKNKKMCV